MHRTLMTLTLLSVAGCASQFQPFHEQRTVVNISDFSTDAVEEVIEPEHAISQTQEEAIASIEEDVVEPVIESQEVTEDVISDTFMPTAVGVPLTVEALVGQVNGRPIYANAVLEPISDQLAAASKKMSRSQFAEEVRNALFQEHESMGSTLYSGRLYELVITDLLLSEASSRLTKEQSYGIFSLINQLRDDLASAQGGSQTLARVNLELESGVSLEEFLEFQREKLLIDALYREKIWPKVNVTWRDIQREFEQISLADFSVKDANDVDENRLQAILLGLRSGLGLGAIPEAKGQVSIGMIRVPKEDEALASDVREAFKLGMSFKEVANDLDLPNDGLWQTFEMGSNGVHDIDVSDLMREKLIGVEEGEVIESFDLGRSTVWLSILDIQKPISIYNRPVQIAVRNQLQWIAFNREKARFIESLWGEGSIEEVQTMSERVANIAVRRFIQ